MELFVFILEMIGTISFAISGAMIGLKQKMDIFGICVMGLVTACGGGVLRDLFIGQLPPVMFLDPIYALTAIIVSLIIFSPSVRGLLGRVSHAYDSIQRIADSAGLGVFTAAGVAAAMHAGYGENFFFALFLGVITGVGGGVLRDVLASLPPYIFVKHIYACASIIGAAICILLWPVIGESLSMMICCIIVFLIRILAARYRWSLPKAEGLTL